MKDSVANFFELVRQDEKVVEQLRALTDNVDEFSRVSCQLGRERGFEFEPADVQAALAALLSPRPAELTEEQLANVAGGAGLSGTSVYTSACQMQTSTCSPGTLTTQSLGCLGGIVIIRR